MHYPNPKHRYGERTLEEQESGSFFANSATVQFLPPAHHPERRCTLFSLSKKKCTALTGCYCQARLWPVYNPSYHELSGTTLSQTPHNTEAEHIAEKLFKYTRQKQAETRLLSRIKQQTNPVLRVTHSSLSTAGFPHPTFLIVHTRSSRFSTKYSWCC